MWGHEEFRGEEGSTYQFITHPCISSEAKSVAFGLGIGSKNAKFVLRYAMDAMIRIKGLFIITDYCIKRGTGAPHTPLQ